MGSLLEGAYSEISGHDIRLGRPSESGIVEAKILGFTGNIATVAVPTGYIYNVGDVVTIVRNFAGQPHLFEGRIASASRYMVKIQGLEGDTLDPRLNDARQPASAWGILKIDGKHESIVKIVDTAEDGAGFESYLHIEPGALHQLSIRANGIEFNAAIEIVRAVAGENESGMYRVGAKFVHLTTEQRAFWTRFRNLPEHRLAS